VWNELKLAYGHQQFLSSLTLAIKGLGRGYGRKGRREGREIERREEKEGAGREGMDRLQHNQYVSKSTSWWGSVNL
jgi:hypothetical protein